MTRKIRFMALAACVAAIVWLVSRLAGQMQQNVVLCGSQAKWIVIQAVQTTSGFIAGACAAWVIARRQGRVVR